jgi:2-phosphoglycerate kinase
VKPIYLIGGAPGTGKSTLAARLGERLSLDHRIGTGFIRAVVQSQTDIGRDPDLFSMTFEADDPADRLERQARRLLGAVLACVDRARREGTSLVVEGSHLIPSLYSTCPVDRFLVLGGPPPGEYMSRVNGPTHLHRPISERDWVMIRKLDDYYRREADRLAVPILVYRELDAVLDVIAGGILP